MKNRILNLIKDPKRIVPVLANRGVFNWLSDDKLLKIQYKDKMGEELNIENPQTFNEKIQWLKLYDRNSLYTNLVDKYEVRKYISRKIGNEYLIPLLGVWDKFEEIDFDKLPNQFVLKCTHDSGGIVICTDKNTLDFKTARRKINRSLNRNYYYYGKEWAYKNIKPRIIAEKYIEDSSSGDLKDYKFMCFNGEPKIIQVMSDREYKDFLINHFDLEWNEVNIPRKSINNNTNLPARPRNLDKMIEISKVLSKDISFVRVDLYETEKGIFFGEMTFYPVSGFMDFSNKEDDFLLGSWIKLPKGS